MASFAASVVAVLEDLINTASLLPMSTEWVPEEHVERLQQYAIFRAVATNQIGPLMDDAEAGAKLRMYGDYGLIVETSRDAVLGDAIGIEVPGSADDDGAAARLDLLTQWAERERWASKLYRGESDAAEVGDAVYELRGEGDRLRLRSHDPESFFPVWQDHEGAFEDAYLAWEERNVGQYLEEAPESVEPYRERDGHVVLYMRHYEKLAREDVPEGFEFRGPEDRDTVCVVTAGWYKIETADGEYAGFDSFERLGFERTPDGEEIEGLDTGFDEIPLFYVPNRETNSQPWGLPEGDRVLRLLLDASQDQTDLKENTYYNAFPPLYDEHEPKSTPNPKGGAVTPETQTYAPGRIFNGRKLGTVDLSKGNAVLLEHEKYLIDKAMTNTRTTHIAAGLLKPGEIPSGVALMIAMMPLISKTLPKRQTRYDKLGMLLKHVIRWHRSFAAAEDFFGEDAFGEDGYRQGEDGWPAGIWEDERAFPQFGAILPIDQKQVSEIVRDLLGASGISTNVAVLMLQAAGFPIEDAQDEVARIQEESALPVGAPGSGFGNEGGGIPLPGVGEEGDAA